MKPIKITVIIPVYNRRDVIQRAVESLLQQDFDQSYEIVVVDDGSTDGTADVIEDRSPLVRVIRQKNAGAAAARRKGIEQARGEYVAFLDSDDVAEPWHLKEHWKAIHRREDVVLSFARVDEFGTEHRGDLDAFRERVQLDQDDVMTQPLVELIQFGCFTASMNLMTTREIALEASRREYDLPASNDYSFTLQASRHGAFAYIHKVTIRIDRRTDGISVQSNGLQVPYGLLACSWAVKQYDGCNRELRTAFRQRLADHWHYALLQSLRNCKFTLTWKLLCLGGRVGLNKRSPKKLWWAFNSVFRGQSVHAS